MEVCEHACVCAHMSMQAPGATRYTLTCVHMEYVYGVSEKVLLVPESCWWLCVLRSVW